ncbi:hypothetical protein [Spirosoma utsteinense]|uniref:Secretion system C-terminal sorting domain-containing protein n=1 Tax=Spirosoma utsteinense TaxID=2585773 RepID=A0ABR6WCR3_9BACT|nr:hypothetical protein [Spirosoma utsteinense]MBC3786923.1 hypothetical protein [Spirosoma utsteinense]MBC3794303.1 hypothetical protein [Spirosoma utsteinense]
MYINLISATAKTLFASLLLSTTLLANPTNPTKPTSFDASLYVTKGNKIRVAVEKKNPEPVAIILRQGNKRNEIVFRQIMGKKQPKLALQLDVNELEDGAYELEIHSASGSIVKQISLLTPTGTKLERTVTIP